MIPKSGYRFSEKIMLTNEPGPNKNARPKARKVGG
jgi:DNA-binding winged helix-turn-helix (wHTH) protein